MPMVTALDVVSYVPEELMLRASVCQEILAAAEMVAAGRGRPAPFLPRKAADWLLAQDCLFSPGVIALAREAVVELDDDPYAVAHRHAVQAPPLVTAYAAGLFFVPPMSQPFPGANIFAPATSVKV